MEEYLQRNEDKQDEIRLNIANLIQAESERKKQLEFVMHREVYELLGSCRNSRRRHACQMRSHYISLDQRHHHLRRPRRRKGWRWRCRKTRPACALWFPFVLTNSLEKDIFSDLFYEVPVAAAASAAAASPGADGNGDGEGKPCKDDAAMAEEECGGPSAASEAPCDLMPPPKSMHASCSRQQTSLANGGDNAGDLSELVWRGRPAGRRSGSRRPVAPRRRRC
uniref:Uncharacterized protein n=1 Tax=Oryza meridionalis TaxID=40149 RepID=A0A0E0EEZ2_9ORYZ